MENGTVLNYDYFLHIVQNKTIFSSKKEETNFAFISEKKIRDTKNKGTRGSLSLSKCVSDPKRSELPPIQMFWPNKRLDQRCPTGYFGGPLFSQIKKKHSKYYITYQYLVNFY